jgi:hypothetical protein
MLALSRGTVDQGDTLFLGPGMDTSAEATGQTLQMGFIQGLVGTGQVPPPSAEPAALLTQREVPVEHDSINAVITTVQEPLVVGTEIGNLFHECRALAQECRYTQSFGTTGQARHRNSRSNPRSLTA